LFVGSEQPIHQTLSRFTGQFEGKHQYDYPMSTILPCKLQLTVRMTTTFDRQ
jgi:hypothetical protein